MLILWAYLLAAVPVLLAKCACLPEGDDDCEPPPPPTPADSLDVRTGTTPLQSTRRTTRRLLTQEIARRGGGNAAPETSVDKVDWNNENWAPNCDFPNTSTFKLVSTDCSRCGPLCWENEDCTHFACKQRQCKFKKGHVAKTAAVPIDQSVCGVTREASTGPPRPIEWKDDNWAFNCDFPKSADLKTVSTECSRCGPICMEEEPCTHFTCKLRECTLKTGPVTRKAATPTSSPTVCGITREALADESVPVIDWKLDNWAFRCDFPTTASITTRRLGCSFCGSECWTNDACTHFTCNENQCTLKRGPVTKAVAEVSPDVNRVCGVTREAN